MAAAGSVRVAFLAACWQLCALLAPGSPTDDLERVLAEGDECEQAPSRADGEPCALNALQLRGERAARARTSALEDEASALGDPEKSCNGTAFDISSQGCCGGHTVFSYAKEACCGRTAVYTSSSQGCCNDKFVFKLSEAGGCTAPGASGASAVGSRTASANDAPGGSPHPGGDSEFACRAGWPIARARRAWSYYCGARSPKVWAMSLNCTQASYKVTSPKTEVEADSVIAACSGQGSDSCKVFDANGTICSEHPQRRYCGTRAYNVGKQACCNGSVYSLATQDCCGGKRVYSRRSQACCAGHTYATSRYGCCGGRRLFRTGESGCCLNDGVQVYTMGAQNCCTHPAGVCTIRHGEWSCCH